MLSRRWDSTDRHEMHKRCQGHIKGHKVSFIVLTYLSEAAGKG